MKNEFYSVHWTSFFNSLFFILYSSFNKVIEAQEKAKAMIVSDM